MSEQIREFDVFEEKSKKLVSRLSSDARRKKLFFRKTNHFQKYKNRWQGSGGKGQMDKPPPI